MQSKKKKVTAIDVPSESECLNVFDKINEGMGDDDKMTYEELACAVSEIWPKFHNPDALITAQYICDLNGNGCIHRNEFSFFLRFLSFYNNYWHIFDHINKSKENEGGFMKVTKGDFVQVSNELQILDADLIFDDMDVDKNGYVTFSDYCLHMAMQTNERKLSSGASFRMANASSSKLLSTARLGTQEKTFIMRFTLDLKCSLAMLNSNATDKQIESWAVFIHNHLANEFRGFHSTERVFAISELADPIQMIAALFQDIIYYEIDGGCLTTLSKNILKGILDDKDDYKINKNMSPDNDRLIATVMNVFNYYPGQRVFPMNKFLCSCVAVRLLKDALPIRQLVKIVACIKATATQRREADDEFYNNLVIALPQAPGLKIAKQLSNLSLSSGGAPFGTAGTAAGFPSKKGIELNDLYDGLRSANDLLDEKDKMTEPKMVKAVQRAADMSNRTNGAFCNEDYNLSLDVIWGLLPEITPALRDRKLYTVFDYHQGVCNLTRALDALDPNTLYVSFQGVPGKSELSSFIRNAEKNIKFAISYTKIKVVSMAIIAAFAQLTGGNVPMSFFMGDKKGFTKQLGDDLLQKNINCSCDYDKRVYDTLVKGRITRRPFDRRKSLVSAFIYKALGESSISKDIIIHNSDYPMTTDKAWVLLHSIPYDVMFPVGIELCKATAASRIDLFEIIMKELRPNKKISASPPPPPTTASHPCKTSFSGSSPNKLISNWSCRLCTFLNKDKGYTCAMCGSTRPSSQNEDKDINNRKNDLSHQQHTSSGGSSSSLSMGDGDENNNGKKKAAHFQHSGCAEKSERDVASEGKNFHENDGKKEVSQRVNEDINVSGRTVRGCDNRNRKKASSSDRTNVAVKRSSGCDDDKKWPCHSLSSRGVDTGDDTNKMSHISDNEESSVNTHADSKGGDWRMKSQSRSRREGTANKNATRAGGAVSSGHKKKIPLPNIPISSPFGSMFGRKNSKKK